MLFVWLLPDEERMTRRRNPMDFPSSSEAIVGKCSVICTSKDKRNPQHSEEELRMADFIFDCTFDVSNYTISDKINDKIAGVEDIHFSLRMSHLHPNYHPNIDNGGRICLDILNLPPKGAWQPSLNISTVLTSIGLLLSELTPDDDLMCEASREYKYNRQTFDQKARSLTEKYEKAGDSGNSSSSRNTPLNPNPSMNLQIEVEGVGLEFRNVAADNPSCKKLSGIRRKLSLESSVLSQKKNADDNGAVPLAHNLSLSQAQSLLKACSSKLLFKWSVYALLIQTCV